MLHTRLQPGSTAKLYKQHSVKQARKIIIIWPNVRGSQPPPCSWGMVLNNGQKSVGCHSKVLISVKICQNCMNSLAMTKTKKNPKLFVRSLWPPYQLMFQSKCMSVADFQKFPRSVLGISCFRGWIVETGSSRTKACSHGYHRERAIKKACTYTHHDYLYMSQFLICWCWLELRQS